MKPMSTRDPAWLGEIKDWPWWPTEARINAGYPGHDREIVAVLPEHDWHDPIPDIVVEALASQCPKGWKLDNRGTRIEVHPTGHRYSGFTNDDVTNLCAGLARINIIVRAINIAGKKA